MPTDKSRDRSQPRVKKSETLEVRIPYETKQAFLTACREDGTTASEVVRESVQTYLDERERPDPKKERTLIVKLPQPVRRYGVRIAAGSLAAVGLTTFAALPVAAAPDFASIFKSMDANGDGVLTAQEFARTGGKDGGQASTNSKVTTRTITIDSDDDAPAAAPTRGATEMKQDAFAFWLPDDDSSVSTQQVNSVQHREVRIVTDSHDANAVATPPSLEDIRADEFKAFDTDKDGKVSLAEFQARHRAMLTRGFEILDSNQDKYLSAMEYAQMSNPPLPHLGGDPPVPDVPVPPGGKLMTPEKLQASFAKLDANKDNRLSLQEYLPPA